MGQFNKLQQVVYILGCHELRSPTRFFFYKNILYNNIEAENRFSNFGHLWKYSPWNIFDFRKEGFCPEMQFEAVSEGGRGRKFEGNLRLSEKFTILIKKCVSPMSLFGYFGMFSQETLGFRLKVYQVSYLVDFNFHCVLYKI